MNPAAMRLGYGSGVMVPAKQRLLVPMKLQGLALERLLELLNLLELTLLLELTRLRFL